MTSPAAEEFGAALAENSRERPGPGRTEGAEALVSRAEAAGDGSLLVDALLNLVSACDDSGEKERGLAPYARLLRIRDERPDDFGPGRTRQLHRMFGRVVGGMLEQPHISLESVREWQSQMAYRHRAAGFSQRAVQQCEFTVAWHLGDIPGAERARTAWQSAARDEASDCHACELHQLGLWHAGRGDDEEALRLWRPVLDGEHSCAHGARGPGDVLASSLLPLLRLGREGEARDNHLRGHHALRREPGTQRALADHLLFCALSGNEPRGLEILAEHGGHWDRPGTPGARLAWTGAVAVLMRRLTELGDAQRQVPGPPGREWTAVMLLEHAADETLATAARFDRRNKTSAVGDAARARMGAQPLVQRLPLDPGGSEPKESASHEDRAPADPPRSGGGADEAGSGGHVRELLAEARRLSEDGHPSAAAAWQRLEEEVTGSGAPLSGVAQAELLDHRAIRLARTDPATGAVRFTEAARLFTDAGDHGQAVACRARSALSTAFAGRPQEALEALEALCAEAVSLHAAGRAGTKDASAVLLSRTRVRFLLLDEARDPTRAAAELDAELADLIAFAGPSRSEPAVLARIADATESRGRLAAALGDAATAAGHFEEAARLYHGAGRPWQATGAELALAQGMLLTGEAGGALSLLRAVLDDPRRAEVRAPEESAQVHIALADACAAQDRTQEEADHLGEAARCAEAAGDGAGLGAYARLRLGGACLVLGRPRQAAGALESALPDLAAGHAESDVVQARWWLAEALSLSGEDRAAAEQFLLAARTAEGWEEQQDHAMLTHLAADALKRADAGEEALRTYERAEGLWRSLGETPALVRALRSRAWTALAVGTGGDAVGGDASAGTGADAAAATRAVELMAEALREVRTGLHAAAETEERLLLQLELGQTYRQTAELLLETTGGLPDAAGAAGGASTASGQDAVSRAARQEALACTDLAVTVFKGCGEAALDHRTSAELLAGWLELHLGRRQEAARRARTVLEVCPGTQEVAGPAAGDPGGVEDLAAVRAAEAASLLAAADGAGEGAGASAG